MLLSIIIPTRNEAGCIATQITHLQRLAKGAKTPVEIIVCDGHSEDATADVARRCGARVLETAPNRGAQQNLGARACRGDVLWFLHADARVDTGSIKFLIDAASRKNIGGGNFRLRFDSSCNSSTAATRAFEIMARAQRARGIYYGDSGIWVRREVFDLLGGFRDWPLFEDYDFARRLESFSRRHGMRTEYSPLPITVSSRRFQNRASKVFLQWSALQILFSLGAPPEKLALWYFRK